VTTHTSVPPPLVGRRVVVIGMAGSGKTTFARALSAKTGLPAIHLDVHYWKPGWVHPSEIEWRETQRRLLAGDAWIADGNYDDTLDVPLARAVTVVLLDTPWWLCAWRAFRRGLRPPPRELPPGCEDSLGRRLRDEWGIALSVWRGRRSEPQRARAIVAEHGPHATLHVLRSRQQVQEFLERVAGSD
jgi:adenylate kinase family enzyme